MEDSALYSVYLQLMQKTRIKMRTIVILACFVSLSISANIPDVVHQYQANTFLFLVQKAGLLKALAQGGPYTVFVPTDAAFSKLSNATQYQLTGDNDLLMSVLKHHIIAGKHKSSEFNNDDEIPTWSRGTKVRINFYGQIMTASGSRVMTRDLEATNGIVHLIDEVMYPIPDKDIIQTCAQRPSLTQLVYSIVRANLQNDLVGGPFTVFAPLDSAFDALPTGYLNTEFLTLDKARNLIEYHYVKGTYYSVGLHEGESVTTSQGTDVIIHMNNGKVMVNNATVVEANVPVTNGVVHIIDTVLVPSKHMDLVNAVDPVGR